MNYIITRLALNKSFIVIPLVFLIYLNYFLIYDTKDSFEFLSFSSGIPFS